MGCSHTTKQLVQLERVSRATTLYATTTLYTITWQDSLRVDDEGEQLNDAELLAVTGGSSWYHICGGVIWARH